MGRKNNGAPKELKQLVLEFQSRGWTVGITGGNHLRWTHTASGEVVFSAATPSDRRAILNIRKTLGRKEKGQPEKAAP